MQMGYFSDAFIYIRQIYQTAYLTCILSELLEFYKFTQFSLSTPYNNINE